MTATTAGFLNAIGLTECTATHGDRAFVAMAQPVPWPKAYGGDLVAQSAAAAIRTVERDRTLHSVHSTFLRGVSTDQPIRYEVELLRDGSGYSTRHVRGYQDERLSFMSTASFHKPEQFQSFAPTMPTVASPESLPTAAETLTGRTGAAAEYWASGRSFDMRHVPGPVYFNIEGDRVPHQAVWVKPFETLPDDPDTHTLAVAYVCDYTILEPILRVLGLPWSSEGLVTASLDHAMWFHRPVDANQWLLYAQECAAIDDGRGLGIGRFFNTEGHLVATVAQEGMIRSQGSLSTHQQRI